MHGFGVEVFIDSFLFVFECRLNKKTQHISEMDHPKRILSQ